MTAADPAGNPVDAVVVCLLIDGWRAFIVCRSCGVSRAALGPVFAQWDADVHNASPAHRVGIAL